MPGDGNFECVFESAHRSGGLGCGGRKCADDGEGGEGTVMLICHMTRAGARCGKPCDPTTNTVSITNNGY